MEGTAATGKQDRQTTQQITFEQKNRLQWPIGFAGWDLAPAVTHERNEDLDDMHIEIVKEYYGRVLRGSSDLKTMACCTPDNMPVRIKTLLSNIHDEVLAKYYGCGLVVPELLHGRRVLDLGCGSGREKLLAWT